MVVGSFASGSDLARQLASLNLADDQPRTKVYVSSSGDTSYATRDGEWAKYVIDVPIIRKVDGNRIELENGQIVDDVDVIIFATGYYYSLPFCKRTDAPWNEVPVLDEEINAELVNGLTDTERAPENGHLAEHGNSAANGHAEVNGHANKPANGHAKRNAGGLRGFRMDNLDSLLLFLSTDRSIAFPSLRTYHAPATDVSATETLTMQNTKSSRFLSPKRKPVFSRSSGPAYCRRSPRQTTSILPAIRPTRSPKPTASAPRKCARS